MDQMLHVSSNPHVRDKMTTSKIMQLVALALLPATLFGIYNFGLRALLVVVITVASSVFFEWIYDKLMHKKNTITDFSAVVTGLLLALNMPASIPLWMPVLGSAFAIIVVKQLFGGLGQNFMNPALAGRCFLMISFAGKMTDFAVSDSFRGVVDTVSGATPLAALKQNGFTDSSVSVLHMFIGDIQGTIGETSALAILIGAAILLVFKVIDLKIPLTYIGSFAVFVILYMLGTGKGFDVNYLFSHIFGGGLMLGAWFMATDYVTTPITPRGQYVYGVCLGVLTAVFRLFGGSAEGVSYAIIFCNLLVPMIERVTRHPAFGKGGQKGMSNRIIKDTIAITVITLVAGLALGVVQDITADPIAKQEAQAKQDAYKAVFADADSFETVDVDADAMQSYLDENGYAAQSIDETMLAKDASGNELGYAFTVTTSEGYGGDIQFAMGIQDDGTLNGISILSIGETAGLGMRANTDAFKDQFKDKNVDKFEYTKTGATADDQIDALSGATITTNAMTNGVNAGLCAFQYEKGGNQ